MKLVFLGPPGAGKGTVAEKAQKDLAVPHVSTGEIFRAAVKNGTPLGLRVKSVIESGALVPDELTIELVRERLGKGDAKYGWILDGFPRTVPQADALEGIDPPDRVVNFELGDEAIVERLSGRRTCPACGRSFHVKFMPPAKAGICDSCGKELITREDDKVESIQRRLSAYRAQTAPLIEYYRGKGRLVTVDASPEAPAVYAAFLGLPGVKKP
jgi:adenylate kinase